MGASCGITSWLSNMESSDWIDLLGIGVNAILAFWIVKTIQNRLTNKRVLKDHFINEIKDIRNDYKLCLNNLYSDQTKPGKVISWFKLMNIRVNDVMSIVNLKYGVDVNKLAPYQRDLQELVTNNEEFINQFKSSENLVFTEASKKSLIIFQQQHSVLFNQIIISINDAD